MGAAIPLTCIHHKNLKEKKLFKKETGVLKIQSVIDHKARSLQWLIGQLHTTTTHTRTCVKMYSSNKY